MILDIFKKKTAPDWKDLSDRQKKVVTNKIAKKIQAMAGARYKVVNGADQLNRDGGLTEYFGEDYYLNQFRRGRMLDMARNAVRNSPTFNSILKQFDLNAVGTDGGKAIFNFDDNVDTSLLKKHFRNWTRQADFFDGLNFNTILKIILKTYIIGGDMVILFDDGLVEDSGKILVYEPDEIGNVDDETLKKKFGKFAWQSQGRVYNGNSRWIGAIVSRSQRGHAIFDPDQSYFLRRNPDESILDSKWIMPRNVFRIAQGRGVSPTSSCLANTIDLEDLCNYELQAAKANSQTLAQVMQTQNTVQEATLPSPFDKDTDFSSMTDAEIEQAAQSEAGIPEQTMTLDKISAAGTIYQVLPDGWKMELLDTKHPNQNIPEFIKWLAGRSSAVYGLTQQYATLQANGNDYRAEMLMAQPAFDECQKFLEQICDWTIYRWAIWADKKGLIKLTSLGDEWLNNVSWAWHKQAELDENSYQDAVSKKLKNLTGSYSEYYGPDWKTKLIQIQKEIDWCKKMNLPHPSYEMISGGERTGAVEIMEK